MGKRIGRATKRRRDQERQERAAYDARMAEMREKDRLADEAARVAQEERKAKMVEARARAVEARAKAKKLTDRLAELGHEIKQVWSPFCLSPPNLFVIEDTALEKLIAALETLPRAVGEAG